MPSRSKLHHPEHAREMLDVMLESSECDRLTCQPWVLIECAHAGLPNGEQPIPDSFLEC
jgi:hypothetical protein